MLQLISLSDKRDGVILLLETILVLWGIEQVALLRVQKAKLSGYAGRSLAIAFIAAFVNLVVASAPPPIGGVLAAVIAAHGLVTAPLLFVPSGRHAAIVNSSPRTRTPLL